MKNMIIKIISLIILLIIVIATPYSNFAAIDTDITSENFIKSMNPNKKPSDAVNAISEPITNSIVTITNGVLGVIQVIGALLTVVSIAIYGFHVLLSANGSLARDLGFRGTNPNNSRRWMEFGRHLLIGSVLMFSSATLVRFIFNIFTQ